MKKLRYQQQLAAAASKSMRYSSSQEGGSWIMTSSWCHTKSTIACLIAHSLSLCTSLCFTMFVNTENSTTTALAERYFLGRFRECTLSRKRTEPTGLGMCIFVIYPGVLARIDDHWVPIPSNLYRLLHTQFTFSYDCIVPILLFFVFEFIYHKAIGANAINKGRSYLYLLYWFTRRLYSNRLFSTYVGTNTRFHM